MRRRAFLLGALVGPVWLHQGIAAVVCHPAATQVQRLTDRMPFPE